MMRPLNALESEWIKKILAVDFKGKKILQQQVSLSLVTSKNYDSVVSILFDVCKSASKFPYAERVPIEMRAFQKDRNPILFLIHVVGGYICELEVLTADSSKIQVGEIRIDSIEHVISDTLMFEEQ